MKLTCLHSWVQTEMGNSAAASAGMEKAPVALEDSINGMLSKVSSPMHFTIFFLFCNPNIRPRLTTQLGRTRPVPFNRLMTPNLLGNLANEKNRDLVEVQLPNSGAYVLCTL